jgi:CheY-like chemotaxis protein
LHFNSKSHPNTSEEKDAFQLLNDRDLLGNYKNRYVPIDVLTIDKHSRLTITKKVKRLIPLYPNHNVIVFQDIYNKNFLLQIKQMDKPEMGSIVDNLILIRNKIDSLDKLYSSKEKEKRSANQNHLLDKLNQNDADVSDTNNSPINGDKKNINIGNKNDTLYSIPILVIEDEQDLLSSYDSALRRSGYRNVKSFSDSTKALRFISDLKNLFSYGLAIIDIRMPGINGIQLYNILKILKPSLKMLFLTALDSVDELTSIYSDVKSEDIIRKPFELTEFVKVVDNKISEIEIKKKH